ncbi:MAG: SEC-C metal-binding domain-containing protein [Balneolaceae bacterium]
MAKKPERNDPCHCGSGKKYKNCCQGKDNSGLASKIGISGLVAAVLAALIVVAIALSGGSGPQDCEPGTVWSSDHGHCH